MTQPPSSRPEAAASRSLGLAELQARLQEAEETLDAIRNGEVDAVVIGGPSGQQVYTLENADRPYRVLIEQMQEGALTLSDDGTVLYCNQRFAALVGEDRGSVVGSVVGRFLREGEREAFHRHVGRPRSGTSSEFTLHTAGRQEVPVNISLVNLKVAEGMPRVICGVVTDLSNSRRRSHELAAANERLAREIDERVRAEDSLRLALDAAGMGSWDLDLATSTLRRSLRYDQIFGHPGQAPGWNWRAAFEQFVPEDRHRVAVAFREAESSGFIEVEVRIVRAGDGATRILHVKGQTFYDAGQAVRIAGVVSDVTDQRAVEEQLRQAQKMEAVGQLTGGIAHDFNNLLMIIGGSLEMLSRRVPSEERTQRLFEAARQGVARGAKLNQQLLAFSRRQELRAESVSVNDLIPTFEHLLDRAVGEVVTIRLDRAADVWLCKTDPYQLETAILNLAINARDAMPGGGTLTLATANRAVGAHAASSLAANAGDYVVVSVTDTGIGMKPEVASRVFEPFFTTKEVGKGTGLGLSQVYGFAKQSEGFVTIESAEGRGTTVSVHLPRTDRAQAAGQAPVADAPIQEGRGVVLVVDDDLAVRTTTSGMLRELGYEVLEAETARAALAVVQSEPRIDLVFSDVVMPEGMSGIDLALDLSSRRPSLPVLLTSGFTAQHAMPGAIADSLHLLRKPYGLSDLSVAVKDTMTSRGRGRSI